MVTSISFPGSSFSARKNQIYGIQYSTVCMMSGGVRFCLSLQRSNVGCLGHVTISSSRPRMFPARRRVIDPLRRLKFNPLSKTYPAMARAQERRRMRGLRYARRTSVSPCPCDFFSSSSCLVWMSFFPLLSVLSVGVRCSSSH